MASPDDGWQTVMPTSQAGMERLPRAQLESFDLQTIRSWEASEGNWSGLGKHTSALASAEAKKIETRFKYGADRALGAGAFGVVEKVKYTFQTRTICVARKCIQYRSRRTIDIDVLRAEAKVMEKLDHDHIVKIVGSYATRRNEIYLLIWPVAVCNLDAFCGDIDALRTKQGDRNDILKRLELLNLLDVSTVEQRRDQRGPIQSSATAATGNCPLRFLRQIMGCITQAVTYCHTNHIRHLDLKPSNILLNPGRVYLADFGIAKDVQDRDRTMTLGVHGTPKWRAPEVCDPNDEWSMNKADIYSLGLVMLNIATVIHAPNMAEFDDILDDLHPHNRAMKLTSYHEKLVTHALASQEVQDASAWTFAPKHVLNLTARMLSSEPAERPRAEQVSSELVELGGIDQIYHSSCCKRSSRFVTELMDKRYKASMEERARLAEENQLAAKRLQVLEAKDETYESRIRNEQKKLADNILHLQDQLEKERKERKRLEMQLAEMQKQQQSQHHHGPRKRGLPATGGIPRPEWATSGGVNSVPGAPTGPSALVMRSRPQTHPLPPHVNGTTAPNSRRPPEPNAPALYAPHPVHAAAASLAVAVPSNAAAANGHQTPSPVPGGAIGFPLRSRGSGSRLPRAVRTPSTPLRAGTPATAAALTRDDSFTDSTQFSMASSIFSRFSSGGSSNGGGVPDSAASPEASPAKFRGQKDAPAIVGASGEDVETHMDSRAGVPSSAVGLGLDAGDAALLSVKDTGSGLNDRTAGTRRNVDQERTATGAISPVMTGSALSSPRTAKADLVDIPQARVVPSLQTAKSWADVARRDRR